MIFALIFGLTFWCAAGSTPPLKFNVAADSPAAPCRINLPIIMYHKVALHQSGKYVVTTQQLTDDFQAIQDAGYTPVFFSEVIAWVNGQGTLPAKPMVITFDDGQYNNLCYVLPIAQKFGFKYVINPVTAYSEKSLREKDTTNPRYSNLSWEAMQTGYASGLVEYGNHSHDLHRTSPRFGVAQKRGEDLATYRQILQADVTHAQDLLTAAGLPAPQVFAYPFGKYSAHTREILQELGFQVFLTCEERPNIITQGDLSSLYALGRYNRSGHTTTAQIIKKLLEQPATLCYTENSTGL